MISSQWQKTPSDGNVMGLFISCPKGNGPFPGLIVMPHQHGVDEFIQQTTRRLAQAGYVAGAPDLYHRDGPDCQDDIAARRSRLSDRRILKDIVAAAEFIRGHGAACGDHLGIIGFCMGGRLVFLGAAAYPMIRAAVAYYPGNLFRAWGRDLPSPFERIGDIQCPVQAHFGTDDGNPSPEDRAKLDAEFTRLNKPHEFFAYDDTGHAFMDDTKESYRRHAAEASWRRTLEFLSRHLSVK